MADALRHRGPDDEGLWTEPGAGLAHRRLSIIDLSDRGRQPMSNEDGTVWTVCNGEIYNFRELRVELEAAGHRFRSDSDSEVLVHLYEDLGPDMVERLDGMFAFAIWDTRKRVLVLARDRVGKKPLKYALRDGELWFGSEAKALLRSGAVAAEPDPEAISEFLARGYVPAPRTGFRGIRKLLPGHVLVRTDAGVDVRPYWRLRFDADGDRRTDAENEELLREKVLAAVRKRLVSDVPLGAFLSGGIDSGIVVACMAEMLDRPVETFSIGFDFERYNELPHARAVAERYSTSHHEFTVRPDAAALLPDLAELYEEPYADASALPSYFLARETRRHVTVALNGDGGDEAFGGYSRYRQVLSWAERTRWARRFGVHALAGALSGVVPGDGAGRLERIHQATHEDVAVRYAWAMRLFSDRTRRELAGDALRPCLGPPGDRLYREILERPGAGRTELDRMQFADIALYLPDDLLVKMDLATMGHGLEARSPFLDPAVLEFAASLPAHLRCDGVETKILLKRAFRDRLPEAHPGLPKRGFTVPLAEWFRGPLRTLVDDLVLRGPFAESGWIEPRTAREVLEEHLRGRVDHGRRLWALTMLASWWMRYVERGRPVAVGA